MNKQNKTTKSFGVDIFNKFVKADGKIWFLFQNRRIAVDEYGQIQTVEYLKEEFNDFSDDIYNT